MMKKRKSGAVAAKEKAEPAGKVVVVGAAKDGEKSRGVAAKDAEGWVKRAGVVAEEQVPWGAMWLPSWDVDHMAQTLYSDVWDGYDDLWGFTTTCAPRPI